MPSPGEADAAAVARPAVPEPAGVARPGADWLREGRELERSGSIAAAIERYEAAIAAEQTGDQAVLAEALRRLAVLRHHRGESERARDLCRRSHDLALQIGDHVLAAEALNTLGGVELSTGLLAGRPPRRFSRRWTSAGRAGPCAHGWNRTWGFSPTSGRAA